MVYICLSGNLVFNNRHMNLIKKKKYLNIFIISFFYCSIDGVSFYVNFHGHTNCVKICLASILLMVRTSLMSI